MRLLNLGRDGMPYAMFAKTIDLYGAGLARP